MKKSIKPDTNLAPVPVVMISCGDMENANITTVAWTGIINSVPPMVSISLRKTRHSYEIINETKEFVMNIPNDTLVWEADYCGTKSGKDEDKYELCHLTKQKSENIKAPGIKECPISLECKVTQIQELGSHMMILAQIVGGTAEEEYIDENNSIQYLKANLLSYVGKQYCIANKTVGERGICLK